jgi:hypothetical protein
MSTSAASAVQTSNFHWLPGSLLTNPYDNLFLSFHWLVQKEYRHLTVLGIFSVPSYLKLKSWFCLCRLRWINCLVSDCWWRGGDNLLYRARTRACQGQQEAAQTVQVHVHLHQGGDCGSSHQPTQAPRQQGLHWGNAISLGYFSYILT